MPRVAVDVLNVPVCSLCLSAAFSSSLTSAADSQDVSAAHNRVSARAFPVAGLLGRHMQPLQWLPGSSSSRSAVQQAALQRLPQRAEHAGVVQKSGSSSGRHLKATLQSHPSQL
jgi:hypothetical protein